MNIWIENPFDNLPTEGYRPQRYWLMARAFLAAGHSVRYWTSDFSHANKAPRRLIEPATNDPFPVEFIPTLPYRSNVSWQRIRSHRDYARKWLNRGRKMSAREKPDIIIASAPPIGSACAAIQLARELCARVVIDVQDAWPETFYRLAPRILFAPLRARIQRAYRDADLVSGVCERYRDLTGRTDYLTAYLGIEPGVCPQRTSRGFRLVYAGNLGRSYDLGTVIEAVRRDSRLTLDIAGTGEFTCACPRVKFHGYLGHAELRQLFAECDLGVIPMSGDTWVGLPNKLFDYTASDLAVVSSLSGETAALLTKHGIGATYRPADVESLLSAIEAAAKIQPGAPRRLCEERFDAREIYRHYVIHVSRLMSHVDKNKRPET